MGNVFRVRTSQKEKRRPMSKIKKFLSTILEFIVVAFVYKKKYIISGWTKLTF